VALLLAEEEGSQYLEVAAEHPSPQEEAEGELVDAP
jgi:hypothetical protein